MNVIRHVLVTAGAVLALTAGAAAQTDFPEKPIQVVVPAGPGSATDTITRLVLNKVEEQGTFDEPFVVVNVTGWPIAATRVHDAAPDGHEILVYHAGMLGLKAVGKLPFGAEAFEPVAQTGSTRFIVVGATDGPYNDFKSLVEAAKAKPGEINEANAIGGAVHIATLLIGEDAGYQARVVNVGDGPKRLQSVLGGHSAYTVVSPQEYLGFQGTGINALAIVGPARNPMWPEVPSTEELGYAVDFSVDTWWFAPKGTPAEVVDKLADAIEKAMADPALKDALVKQGVDPVFLRDEAVKDRITAVDNSVQPLASALQGQ